VKTVTFVDQDDPFGVASPARLPIVKMSSNAWVRIQSKICELIYRSLAGVIGTFWNYSVRPNIAQASLTR
jgi:hypothetical protein